MDAKQSLLSSFQDGTLSKKTVTEICKILDIPYREKKRLTDLLDKLVEEGKVKNISTPRNPVYVPDNGHYTSVAGE